MNATYNITNNRLKLYIERRLTEDEYSTAKNANFQWWPGQKCFSAVWTPQGEDFILSLGIMIEEDDTPDDLEGRVNRFQSYAANDEQSANDAALRSAQATTKRRAEQAERTAINKLEEAQYWNRRIEGAISRAQYRERPDVIARRIKGLEADKRKHEKNKKQHEYFLSFWNRDGILKNENALSVANYDNLGIVFSFSPDKYPNSRYPGERSLWSALSDNVITPQEAQKLALEKHNESLIYIDRWINHLTMLIDYERAYLGANGGNPADKLDNIKTGDFVTYRGERCKVLNAGKVNLRLLIPSNTWQKNGALVGREKCKP